MPVSTQITQTLSISISLLAAGSIATFSIFDVPQFQSQPADRSLPMIRWLFSRGSHLFPQAAAISGAGFAYLAYDALPNNLRTLSQLLKTGNSMKVNGYVLAAVLAVSIGPFTRFVMVPNNFALMKKNEEKGGARSAESAKTLEQSGYKPGDRTAEDSVYSKGEASQFTDLSIPQSKTNQSSSKEEDKEVQEMLSKFGRQNLLRAGLIGFGGIVGLFAALL